MLSRIHHFIGTRIEQSFAGGLTPTVRYNLYTELWGSIAYGVFWATALQFIPPVLRRMGATSDAIALYTALTYLGSLLTSFSIVLMRQRRTKQFAVWCWAIARAIFLLFAFITDIVWFLVLMAFFWLLEAFPSPAYTRILQAIYPTNVRGRAMSVVRFGMTGAMLIVTPIAGWGLDHFGHRLLFPIAALMGLLATYSFSRLRVDEGTLPPRQTRSMPDLIGIIRKNRNFALHLLAFTVYGVGSLIAVSLYPVVQVNRLALSFPELGWLGLVQSFAWLIGFVVWGNLVDKRGGLWVLRINLAIGALVPASYIWATRGWMLLPAFLAQGIIMAGVDLGITNTCIQLAEPEKVVEYAAIQSTTVGLRGIISPFLGVLLLRLGVDEMPIFVAGTLFVLLSWVIIGYVHVPLTSEQMGAQRHHSRFRWPIRFRVPRM